MATRNYWIDLFTWETWQEFLYAGANVTGFTEKRWKTVQNIKVGDYLLCYLTGVSSFIGLLEVTTEPFQDSAPIWKSGTFSSRVGVELILNLKPETSVIIQTLREQLSIFKSDGLNSWSGYVRSSPTKFSAEDGKIVVNALKNAYANPIVHEIDPKKLAKLPKASQGPSGISITVPESETPSPIVKVESEFTDHTEIQYLLLMLGHSLGFDIWVAKNDRNRVYQGKKFSENFKLKSSLPRQFDEHTMSTIEHIDVLWLKSNSFVAAFEIESTTSIYSGLLRMSDLVTMQPNLKIPLYLVAPDERRQKVFEEVNRATFSHLKPPLAEVCQYISFSRLRDEINKAKAYLSYLKFEFLDSLAELCEVQET